MAGRDKRKPPEELERLPATAVKYPPQREADRTPVTRLSTRPERDDTILMSDSFLAR